MVYIFWYSLFDFKIKKNTSVAMVLVFLILFCQTGKPALNFSFLENENLKW